MNMVSHLYVSSYDCLYFLSVRIIYHIFHKVLNAAPPKISDSEKVLPRETRSTLAQLRSGYSNYLNSYKARISQNQPTPIIDTCPHCNDASHTTNHLFSCRNNPTTLNVRKQPDFLTWQETTMIQAELKGLKEEGEKNSHNEQK